MSDEIDLPLYTVEAISLYSQTPVEFAGSANALLLSERAQQIELINYNYFLSVCFEECN